MYLQNFHFSVYYVVCQCDILGFGLSSSKDNVIKWIRKRGMIFFGFHGTVLIICLTPSFRHQMSALALSTNSYS